MLMLYSINIHPTKYSLPEIGPFSNLPKNDSADKRVCEKSIFSLLDSRRQTEMVAEWRQFRT